MKTIASEFAFFLRGRARQNIKSLIYYCLFLLCLVLIYAVIFRTLMWHLEGREFSLIAGIYWTITVMTTLGFGDITFHSDPGYVFAAIVTISGVVLLLIILPFSLISLFIAPWIEQKLHNRLIKELPQNTSGHVIIFGFDATTRAFIGKLKTMNIPYFVVTANKDEALRLDDEGFQVIIGEPTDADILDTIQVATARLVVANLSDPENASACLAINSRCETPIVAFVGEEEHISLMRQAGADRVIPLHKILGRYLAIRATTCGALAHILDSFGELQIAEIPVHGTPFSGVTLKDAQIRQKTGLAVIGLWKRGSYSHPTAETIIEDDAMLVLAGSQSQLENLERITGEQATDDLVFIIGHGRIGCSAANFLERKPVPFILVDRDENPQCEEHVPLYGDATIKHVLCNAGIEQARGVIVTTNDDNTNIFLALAIRNLLPHIRLVARANREESVDQLYLAGADFVVSNASVGANILINILESKASAFLTEGINVFRRPLPDSMLGKTISDSMLRPRSGCSIVALEKAGKTTVSPAPETVLEEDTTLILIGSPEQEEDFDQNISDHTV